MGNWTAVIPGRAGMQIGRVDGYPCVMLSSGGTWMALLVGGNQGRRLIERHQIDDYNVLVTGPLSWLWGRKEEAGRSVDFYEFLGVSRDATRREILAAYEALPAELRSSPAAQICVATLGDPTRRAQYDAQLIESERQLRRIELRSRLAWSVVMIGAGLALGGLLTLS